MDKKRLDEIRETLSNGDHLTRLDRDDLLAMIAAALVGPSDEAVGDAIADIEAGVDCSDEYSGEEYVELHLDQNQKALIITALRQMRTEPCEWCKPSDKAGYEGVKPLDFIVLREFDGWDEYESRLLKNYCPNCGRPLKEG